MSQTVINSYQFAPAPPSAGLLVETGTFTKTVSPTTVQNVAVGFQPKALIIWGYRRATSDIDQRISASQSWGVVDDAGNNACIFWGEEDFSVLTQNREGVTSLRAIKFLEDDAIVVRCEGTITLTPSGFNIFWNIPDSLATRMHFIAYGGDDITGVQARGLTLSNQVPPSTESVTTDADCQNITEGNGILFMAGNTKGLNTIGSDITSGIGMATKANAARGCVNYTSRFGRPTSEARQTYSETHLLDIVGAVGALQIWLGDFGGFTSAGFEIDWTTDIIPFRGLYLIIKGGNWESGNEAASTTVGTKVTNTELQPKGLYTMSLKRTTPGTAFEDMNLNVGAVDGLTNTSGGMTNLQGTFVGSRTTIGALSSSTKVQRYNEASTQTVVAESDLDSFNANNFTLDWTTVDGNPYKYLWAVCGNQVAQGMLVETGNFAKVVSPTGSQSVAVGFQPKALIIWGFRNATSDTDTGAEAAGSWGLVDDDNNNASIFWIDKDGVGTVEAFMGSSNSLGIKFMDSNLVTDAAATITLTATGFDISWSPQDSVASIIHFIAYGGTDITGTQVSDFAMQNGIGTQNIPTDADVQNITEGNGVIFAAEVTPLLNVNSANFQPTIGIATKTNAFGSIYFAERFGQANAQPRQSLEQTKMLHQISVVNGSLFLDTNFAGFTASGWDIEYILNSAANTPVIFLIIKGGNWKSGNETARTTTGTKFTPTTFQPKGLFALSVKRTADGTAVEDLNLNIGAVDGITNASGGMTDEAGAAVMNIGVMSSNTKTVRYNNAVTQAVLSEAELDSFNQTGFTLDWTTVDGNPYKYIWAVCGNQVIPSGLLVESGTFTKVVTPTTTQSVNLGFKPKALVIWGYKNKTTDTDSGGTAAGFWGLVDDAGNNRSLAWQNEDADVPVNANQFLSITKGVIFISDIGTTIEVEGTITLTEGGFDITWDTQNAIASRIHFIAYGGTDVTGAQVGSFTKTILAAPPDRLESITTDADCQNIVEGQGVVFLGYLDTLGGPGLNYNPSIGIGTKTTQFGCVYMSENTPGPPTQPFQAFLEDKIIHNTAGAAGTILQDANFSGFDAAGFDITWTVNNTNARPVIFLIIKGGQWESGFETANTIVGQKITPTTFEPRGLFNLSVKRTAAGEAFESINHNIGATDGITNNSGAITSETGASPTNIGDMSSITNVVRYNNPVTQAVVAEAALQSFNAANFTLDWTTVDGSAYKFMWLICGNT